MNFNTIKNILDNNIDKNMINSAATLSRYSEQNSKLALAISEEQERKEKQFMSRFEKQINLLESSLKQSEEDYKKLNELYELKSKELNDSKQELKESKKYNRKMLIIALVSAGISIVSLMVSILFNFI